MSSTQRLEEMDFELALCANLEDIYGLQVRVSGDPLNRRQNGYTTLYFEYEPRACDGETKVVVSIAGSSPAAYAFCVDLGSSDSIETAVSDCDDLALAIREQQDAGRPGSEAAFRRREDD